MLTRTKAHQLILLVASLGIFVLCLCNTTECQDVNASKEGYFPLEVGNWWVYTIGGRSGMGAKTVKWKVTQREMVHGTAVFHLWQTPARDDEPLSLSVSATGILEAGTERFLLKNPLRVGDRWTAKSRSLRAQGKSDIFEVLSVGSSCSAGVHLFDDCATLREIDEANHVASLTTYARKVGPVKYVYFKDLSSDKVDTTLTIKSWNVK